MLRTNFFETKQTWRTLALLSGLAMICVLLLFELVLTAKPAHAATFTVNRIFDDSDMNPGDGSCDTNPKDPVTWCTLRAAIQEANATPGADTINFAIEQTGVQTIEPNSPLPIITDPVTIDGYTQPGASANTLAEGNNADLKIQLNGIDAGANVSGLEIRASNSTIKGLVINRFSSHGVIIRGSGVTGNFIEGNFIGTNVGGTEDRGNTSGVVISGAANNIIGGTQPAQRNVISGNTGGATGGFPGVLISDSSGFGATGNQVMGNYIGTTADGTEDLGNTGDGVIIREASDRDVSDSTVGGATSGARNVISGNKNGVSISGSGATDNKVEGNFIGTAADGTGDLGNDLDGVFIADAPNNTIGGTASGAGNRISGNGDDGVLIFNGAGLGDAEFNKVERNGISGNTGDGVIISNARNNTIGGTVSGVGNGITANGDDGVEISGSGATGNRVLGNSIFANTAGLGIDLGADGVTANDDKDLDTGANNLQNFPVITSARKSSTSPFLTTISGTINSNTNRTFTIQCFVAVTDPSGHGEGQIPVGQTTVTTNFNGAGSFSCPASPVPQAGQFVTATATRLTSFGTPIETSEFSQIVEVVFGP